MEEHEYYNLSNHSHGDDLIEAKQYILSLMVAHLRTEHQMKMVDIHNRLGVPMKFIREVIEELPSSDRRDILNG
jgi:hypothetical protein